VVITYKQLQSLEFPLYVLPHDNWECSDGLLFIDGRVVDDKNQGGVSLGQRRLQTPHPVLPLSKQLNSIQGILKQTSRTFVDTKGRPFIYEKTIRCTLKYYKITKIEKKETESILWLKNVGSPFSVPRPPETGYNYAGILLLGHLPWILYEYSQSAKKDTWRKV
tara:strand:- start:9470 stop:9961 length:492 start_codon:yes stop_codon:yes gene_type:complete